MYYTCPLKQRKQNILLVPITVRKLFNRNEGREESNIFARKTA
jgi:hypothetical protein